MAKQLPLFELPPAPTTAPEVLPHVTPRAIELAAHIPDWIRLGTSSWTFPGWKGLVYAGSPSREALVAHGLRAYAAHPLLRTVGIDRSYYGPLTAEDLRGYAADLADAPTFRPISKVWDEITTVVFPPHARYGERAGKVNSGFMNVERFMVDVLAPFEEAFASHMGPFVLEVPPFPAARAPKLSRILGRIDDFLSAMPKQLRLAFEVRNKELLVPEYFSVLRKHGAAHVFNFWTGMPTIRMQLRMRGSLTTDFVVSRLMLPPFVRYEDQKAAFEPFDRIQLPQPEMRADVLDLLRAAAGLPGVGGNGSDRVKEAFIVANNKAEGSSPLTLFALAELIAQSELRANAP